MTPTTVLTTIATIAVLATGGTFTHGAGSTQTGSRSREAPPAERVSLRSGANDLFVAVQPDGTLAAWSSSIGAAEQFDLFDLGGGLIALRAAVNGRFVTARTGEPLEATAHSAGVDATFRRVGGRGAYGRLRAVDAQTFACAQGGGLGVIAAVSRCPHDWQLLDIQPLRAGDLAILAPAAGTALRSTTATFQWTGEGDDFSLTIGSAAGASDVYASGSLGTATQHTVSNLPLNGSTLYVRLHRRLGTGTDVVNAQYTAPVRKGLLVITDFADRSLEDWTGEGMNTVNDVSVQLRAMEAHWAWLSRGLERIHWDIIRVTLTQRCVADAFSGWTDFRTTVAGLVRQQVAVADYDVNDDLTIDAAWLIVSAGGGGPTTGCAAEIDHWALGGSSANGGVNMFVDGQASRSVASGATGNFNHELGHLLGLVDMYGPYDTLHGLTLMSYSWPVPPHDFAAYERRKLGWLKPWMLSETTRGVWLPSAHDAFAAVMIPTARPYEYFLIEYRRRPDSGYGSQNPPFNGLAVYHVLEGSSMSQNPPIVKLEPADGSITPGGPLDPADFVYPENPALLRPLVLHSYLGDAPEVFRVENVSWRDDGLSFDVVFADAPEPANLLTNASFESGTGTTPQGWTTGSWVSGGSFVWENEIAYTGEHSAALIAPSPNDMWWSQRVSTLVPGGSYMLCGSLKGEDIGPGAAGGNVSVLGGWVGSYSLFGTFDWTRNCVTFVAETPTADVACRLGFYGGTVSGRLWCDGLTLERLRRPF